MAIRWLQDTFVKEPEEEAPSTGQMRGIVVASTSGKGDVVGEVKKPPPPTTEPPLVITGKECKALHVTVVPAIAAPVARPRAPTPPGPPQLRDATERERTLLWMQSRVTVVLDGWYMIGLVFLVLAALTWQFVALIIHGFA